MANRFREAAGVVNGANQDFTTPTGYVAGTLRAFLNGRMVARDLDDGFTETDPPAGAFRMKIPPVTGDTVFAFYEEV